MRNPVITFRSRYFGLRRGQHSSRRDFFYFKKAFDKVPHGKLIIKLKSYGLDEDIICWIREFLSDRVQRVVLDGAFSDEVRVTSGVPQGSVIGPLLFLLYINDIGGIVHSKLRFFADDAVVYREIRSSKDRDELTNDLAAIQAWCDNCNVVDILACFV